MASMLRRLLFRPILIEEIMLKDTLDIIKTYELGDVVRWILENNPSQALPYHNFQHSLDVMYHSAFAYCYKEDSTLNKVWTDIENCVVPKELLYAALFHDFGHSGGFFANDADNIEVAIEGLERYAGRARASFGRVLSLIQETQYPHSPADAFAPSVEYRLMRDCLLDADMFQHCVTTMSSMVGIRQEMFKHIPWAELVQRQIEFMSSIQYRTLWGQQVAEPKKQEVMQQLRDFRDMCFNQ